MLLKELNQKLDVPFRITNCEHQCEGATHLLPLLPSKDLVDTVTDLALRKRLQCLINKNLEQAAFDEGLAKIMKNEVSTLTLNAARSYWLQDQFCATAFKTTNSEFADWLKSDHDLE